MVLRKAQHLHELSLETAKSSIGQDHSYVRSDHAAQQITTSFDGLDALIKAISYRESETDNECKYCFNNLVFYCFHARNVFMGM